MTTYRSSDEPFAPSTRGQLVRNRRQAREVEDHAIRGLRPEARDDHRVERPPLVVERRDVRPADRSEDLVQQAEARVKEPAEHEADDDLAQDERHEEEGADDAHAAQPLMEKHSQRETERRRHGVAGEPAQVVRERGLEHGIGPELAIVSKADPDFRVDAVPVVERQRDASQQRIDDKQGEEQAGRRQQDDGG